MDVFNAKQQQIYFYKQLMVVAFVIKAIIRTYQMVANNVKLNVKHAVHKVCVLHVKHH